ncbi:hypothetical protein EIP86_010206 [Pleurotus ostreatoroseus]|nr:hypothetical protein EIP86_010206 [Pleurotus ostreatoroseus]
MAVGFAVDATLIAMMLVGTWMYKGAGNLWRLVLNQGVVWAVVALLCYLPTVVLLALDLNGQL